MRVQPFKQTFEESMPTTPTPSNTHQHTREHRQVPQQSLGTFSCPWTSAHCFPIPPWVLPLVGPSCSIPQKSRDSRVHGLLRSFQFHLTSPGAPSSHVPRLPRLSLDSLLGVRTFEADCSLSLADPCSSLGHPLDLLWIGACCAWGHCTSSG